MTSLAIILVKLLDPIAFTIAALLAWMGRSMWIIPVAAVVSALSVETLLTAIELTRQWGEMLPLELLAGFAHAALAYWLIGAIRKRPIRT